ncbi:MAG: hypothetical protein JO257_23070 [Deltaproteobacteria bacterium]|nr:hypothetical protein [Deltaproteobacteria bacterium]
MIDALATDLVQQAPDLDPDTIAALRTGLEQQGSALALAVSRIVELVAEGLVDMAIALPPIAEACNVLVSTSDARVLAAMKYQIDTLEPMPDQPPRIAAPDVPINRVRRR